MYSTFLPELESFPQSSLMNVWQFMKSACTSKLETGSYLNKHHLVYLIFLQSSTNKDFRLFLNFFCETMSNLIVLLEVHCSFIHNSGCKRPRKLVSHYYNLMNMAITAARNVHSCSKLVEMSKIAKKEI